LFALIDIVGSDGVVELRDTEGRGEGEGAVVGVKMTVEVAAGAGREEAEEEVAGTAFSLSIATVSGKKGQSSVLLLSSSLTCNDTSTRNCENVYVSNSRCKRRPSCPF
jgi:hypothetical protein